MSDNLNQTLGFDASSAIAELTRLNQVMQTAESTTSKWAHTLGRFSGSTTTSELKKISQATRNTSNEAAKAASKWAVSMETMSRVVVTQFIVRALSQIRNAFSESIESATEFQRKVAEIGTISGGQLGGFDTIGDKVRAISDYFGTDLDDTGQALYQTISNQIEAAKSMEFMAESAYFAKGGVTELESSVNLLSGTLNAFHMDTERAAEIASKFFTTIEFGRTRASELATSFGRAAPLADKLGISFDELAASYATVTINGIKTSEATTQIVGVMNALIKPSKEMAKALHELGFASGEEAIATLGWQGALKAVIDTTDGSSTAIGKLVPRVRGLNAALILTGKGAETYAKNLQHVHETTNDLNKSKGLEIMGTDAETVHREWQKLSNFFTTDFGTSLLSANRSLFELTGGADGMIAAIKAAIPILGAGATALGVLGAKALFTSSALRTMMGSMGGLPTALLAVGAATSAYQAWTASLRESSQALQALEQSNAQALETFKQQEQQRLQASRDTDAKRLRSLRQSNQELTKSYREAVDQINQSSEQIAAKAAQTLSKLVQSRKDAVRQLTKAAEDSANAIIASQDRVYALTQTAADKKFQRSLTGKDDTAKAMAMMRQANELGASASKSMQAAMDPQAIERAVDKFNQALRMAERAEDLASGTGNTRLMDKTENVVDRIIDKQINAEKKLQGNQSVLQASSRERAELEQQILDTLKLQVDTINDSLKAWSKGEGLDKQKLAEALQGVPVDLQFEIAKGVDNVQAQLNSAFENYKIKLSFDVGGLEKLTGDPMKAGADAFAGVKKLMDEEAALLSRESASNAAQLRYASARAELDKRLRELNTPGRLFSQGAFALASGNTPEAIHNLMEQFRKDIQTAATSQVISPEMLGSLDEYAAKLRELANSRIVSLGFADDVEYAIGALEKLKTMAEAQKAIQLFSPTDEARAANIRQYLDSTVAPAAQVEAHFRGAAVAAEQAAAAIAKAAKVQAAAQDTVSKAMGGYVYRASGGAARGTDTIPAMLSPGEFVVNARSTRQFFSQLQAINAGVQPIYRESGGEVTNISVGDVNISGSTTPMSPGDIARAINREIRRGKVKLR